MITFITFLTLRSQSSLVQRLDRIDDRAIATDDIRELTGDVKEILPSLFELQRHLVDLLQAQAAIARSWELSQRRKASTEPAPWFLNPHQLPSAPPTNGPMLAANGPGRRQRVVCRRRDLRTPMELLHIEELSRQTYRRFHPIRWKPGGKPSTQSYWPIGSILENAVCCCPNEWVADVFGWCASTSWKTVAGYAGLFTSVETTNLCSFGGFAGSCGSAVPSIGNCGK